MTQQRSQTYRFYGRTQGKKISSRGTQLLTQELPHILYEGDPMTETFWSAPIQHRCLEIGFGGGEHMIERLTQEPKTGFLGIEPFKNGLVKVLSAIQDNPSLENRLRISSQPIQNLWPYMPNCFFHEIVVFFPDPWPKKKHHKRKLLSAQTLSHITRVLKPDGILKIASDDPNYMTFILENLKAHPFLSYQSGIQSGDPLTWSPWPSSWPITRYGRKALEQGKPLGHIILKRI